MVKKNSTKLSKQNGASVVAPIGKKAKKPVKEPEPESEESSEEEMEMAPVSAKRKAVPAKNGNAKKLKQVVPEPESEEEDDDSEEDSEEESEEEEQVKQAPVKKGKVTPAAAAEEDDSDEEDEDEDDDEDDEESDEDEVSAPAAPAAVAKNGKAAAEEESDDEASEEEDEESEEEEESDDEMVKKSAGDAMEKVTFYVGNLPEDDGNRQEQLRKFFGKNGIQLEEARAPPNKSFAFVTLVNAADKNKAAALNSTLLGSNTLRINLADSQPNSAPSTEGNKVVMFAPTLSSDAVKAATGATDVSCMPGKPAAFLTFGDASAAKECVANSPLEIDGVSYNCEISRSSGGGFGDRGRGGGGFRGSPRGGGRGGFSPRGGGFSPRGGRGGPRGGGRGRGGFRGGRGGGQAEGCRNCGGSGHFARECPKPPVCRKCNQSGHIAVNCPA